MNIYLRVFVVSSLLTSTYIENEEEMLFLENMAYDISVFYYFCIDFSHE